MVALNELLSLLLKVPVFREFLKPIAVLRRLFLLSKENVSKIRKFNIIAYIKDLPPVAKSQVNAAIKRFAVGDILQQVWATLTPDIKKQFVSQLRFDKLLGQLGGKSPIVRKVKEGGKTAVKNTLEFLDITGKRVYNEWVDVISIAVKRTRFIPIDRYKKSGTVAGVTQIQFRTGNKVYDYFNAPLNNYNFWWKAVNQPGPVDGHGYWSFVLDNTQGSRLGATSRGYLKRAPIVSGYKLLRTRQSGEGKSAARFKRFSYLKTMPQLKMRRSLKPLQKQ